LGDEGTLRSIAHYGALTPLLDTNRIIWDIILITMEKINE
tara:strand:- start:503 stop:622 length:120 start_codon:yes stop_codon:yes gene_type:complete